MSIQIDQKTILIIGANGQVGRELQARYPHARAVDADELDITSRAAVDAFNWSGIKILINAAAYTDVDGAETPEGRVAAWKVNATGVQNLAHAAWNNDFTLVHISTDYVFDGTGAMHSEDEPFTPLNSYGASKAAGDLLAAQNDNHYIIRTSWVIGEGKNFVRTMLELGNKGINPTVVADQIGRPTFTGELVRAINHLLTTQAPFGTYNVTNGGHQVSWADIAREVFKQANMNNTITDTTTTKYTVGKVGVAPRPANSTLDLAKISATGFNSRDWKEDLQEYIQKEQA